MGTMEHIFYLFKGLLHHFYWLRLICPMILIPFMPFNKSITRLDNKNLKSSFDACVVQKYHSNSPGLENNISCNEVIIIILDGIPIM